MAFQPAPNCVALQIRYTLDTELIENTLSFSNGSDPTQEQIDELTAWVADTVVALMVPNTNTELGFREVSAYDAGVPDGEVSTTVFSTSLTGALLGGAMPNQDSLFCVFKANGRGRTNRGGCYWPAIPRGAVTGNTVSGAYAGVILDFWNEIRTGAPTNTGFEMGFISRRINGAARPAGVFKKVLSCSLTDLIIDSQNGRKPGSS